MNKEKALKIVNWVEKYMAIPGAIHLILFFLFIIPIFYLNTLIFGIVWLIYGIVLFGLSSYSERLIKRYDLEKDGKYYRR